MVLVLFPFLSYALIPSKRDSSTIRKRLHSHGLALNSFIQFFSVFPISRDELPLPFSPRCSASDPAPLSRSAL